MVRGPTAAPTNTAYHPKDMRESVTVRPENGEDIDSIRALLTLTFGQGSEPPPEARLVDELRASDGWLPDLSLVAEIEHADKDENTNKHKAPSVEKKIVFQAKALSAWSPSIKGQFRYAKPFNDLS